MFDDVLIASGWRTDEQAKYESECMRKTLSTPPSEEAVEFYKSLGLMPWKKENSMFTREMIKQVELPESYHVGVSFHDGGATVVVMKYENDVSTIVHSQFYKEV